MSSQENTIKTCVLPITAFSLAAPITAHANDQDVGIGLGHTQKLWNDILDKPHMTSRRLATSQTVKEKQICVYAGANRTYVAT